VRVCRGCGARKRKQHLAPHESGPAHCSPGGSRTVGMRTPESPRRTCRAARTRRRRLAAGRAEAARPATRTASLAETLPAPRNCTLRTRHPSRRPHSAKAAASASRAGKARWRDLKASSGHHFQAVWRSRSPDPLFFFSLYGNLTQIQNSLQRQVLSLLWACGETVQERLMDLNDQKWQKLVDSSM